MLKLELKPENPTRPGFARLVIHKWAGDTNNVTLSVQRNQDQRFLASDSAWVGSEVFHILPRLQEDGDSFSVGLGPDIVDPLLASRENAYRLKLSDNLRIDEGRLIIDNDVISSLAGGSNVIPNRLQPLTEPLSEPPVAESAPEPIVTPPPDIDPPLPVPPVKKPPLTWLWLLLAVLVLAGLIGAWLLLKPSAGMTSPATRSPAAETVPIPATPTTPSTAATGVTAADAAAPCAPETMKTTGELDFVKGCLQSQPNSAQVLAIISQAKEQKHCDVAQRLYAYKAQSGDTAIALKYAHEYDPLTAVKGGCFTADAETAVYWYEMVINQDAHNAEAKTRLNALKK
ncbi:hypothetical protein SJI19_13460 [Acerihabitans sp. TG2]|uniref:hypothetical protein n=1 Tax=Acerihabitans sp. TG2 TaxID=3096008 RepID=UPI002B236576|nr:hypothetical protein [Acerihabitans sp. TG2]MEA9391537.1 hypothetical protein [Acerihabitans sp. TG2]